MEIEAMDIELLGCRSVSWQLNWYTNLRYDFSSSSFSVLLFFGVQQPNPWIFWFLNISPAEITKPSPFLYKGLNYLTEEK